MKKIILLIAVVTMAYAGTQAQSISTIYGKCTPHQPTYIDLSTDTLFLKPGTSLWGISLFYAVDFVNGNTPLSFGDTIVYDLGLNGDSFAGDSIKYKLLENVAVQGTTRIEYKTIVYTEENDFQTINDSTFRLVLYAKPIRTSKFAIPTASRTIVNAIFAIRTPKVSINESSIEKVKLFPNPVNSSLNITNLNNTKVEIFNVVGQRILTHENISGNLNIDMTAYPNGIYFVKMQNGKSVRTEKIKLTK